jgi:hypothetical protein
VAPAPDDFDRVFYAVDDALTGGIPSTPSFRETLSRLTAGGELVARRFLESALAHLRTERHAYGTAVTHHTSSRGG